MVRQGADLRPQRSALSDNGRVAIVPDNTHKPALDWNNLTLFLVRRNRKYRNAQ